jgi:hypothetical protein
MSEFEFSPNFASSRDFYHTSPGLHTYCGAADRVFNSNCSVGLDPRVNSGWVYMTVHSLVSDYTDVHAPLTGEMLFEVVPPTLSFILPAQLRAVRDLYLDCCKPFQDTIPIWDLSYPAGDLNRHWTRRNHMRGAYAQGAPDAAFLFLNRFNTTGDERNPDAIPFCDWLFTSRLDAPGRGSEGARRPAGTGLDGWVGMGGAGEAWEEGRQAARRIPAPRIAEPLPPNSCAEPLSPRYTHH